MPKITLVGYEKRDYLKKDANGKRIDGEYATTIVLHYTYKLVDEGAHGSAAGFVTVFDRQAKTLPALHIGKQYFLDKNKQRGSDAEFECLEPLFDEEPFTADITGTAKPDKPTKNATA